MMKFLNKKRKVLGNKGFSLVELIIVIAIMAVLMAVLAPQLLKYVEKSRVQADNSAASEILNVVKIAISDDAIYTQLNSTEDTVVTWNAADTGIIVSAGPGATDLDEEIAAALGSLTRAVSSQLYKTRTYTITIEVDAATGIPTASTVGDGWEVVTP
jgi:type IV pilus assembly protein PilA